MKIKNSRFLLSSLIFVIISFFCLDLTFAAVKTNAEHNVNLNSLTKQIETIIFIIKIVLYTVGVACTLLGILKFKAHKANPKQIQLLKAAKIYLFIGLSLLLLLGYYAICSSLEGNTLLVSVKQTPSTKIINNIAS